MTHLNLILESNKSLDKYFHFDIEIPYYFQKAKLLYNSKCPSEMFLRKCDSSTLIRDKCLKLLVKIPQTNQHLLLSLLCPSVFSITSYKLLFWLHICNCKAYSKGDKTYFFLFTPL